MTATIFQFSVVFPIRKTTKTDEITFSTVYFFESKRELASVSSDRSLDLTESRFLR